MNRKCLTLTLFALGFSIPAIARAGDSCGYYRYPYGCYRPVVVRIYPRCRMHVRPYESRALSVRTRSGATNESIAPAPIPSPVSTEQIQPEIAGGGQLASGPGNVATAHSHAGHNHAAHNHAGHNHAAHSEAEPAAATTTEQATPISAAKDLPYGGQKTCPVLGEDLASMGDPIPVQVKGQTIYVCCNGCVNKVKKDPDKYLKKVEAERSGRS
jgi:hypothetical protein